MAKKSQKQKMQAMAAESQNASNVDKRTNTGLTQNEAKFNSPSNPST